MKDKKLEERCRWKIVYENVKEPKRCRVCDGYKFDCFYYWGKHNVFGFETSADVSLVEIKNRLETEK